MATRKDNGISGFFFRCPAFRVVILTSLLFQACSIVAEAASYAVVVTNSGRVLRVFAEGKIEELPVKSLEQPSAALGQGTTRPVPSPNQHLVAFTRDNDLWVINLGTDKQVRATTVGKPYTNTYASIFIYITSWSWDNKQILYSVEHGETEDPEGETPTLKVRPANYGFYIYDLEKKTSRRVSIPGEFRAWLPGGELLVVSQTTTPLDQQLLRVREGETKANPVTSLRGSYTNVSLSADGRWLLTGIGKGPSKNLTSQIMKIDLVNGSVTSLTPPGKWAEYQWPQFSPSAMHFAYVWQQGLDSSGLPRGMLVVDGQAIQPYEGYLLYRWVDEQSLVMWRMGRPIVLDDNTLKFNEEVTVIDSKTGKVKGQRVFQ